ncbi:hypothetical protein H5410_002910 [Solanum commersonii]|uniref:Endonuclease/exonuclease/phosphatase domain-containing protein n=1 Tax=Solanum commersonii TaxID=4109 RepID=A0A9J6B3B2_SOLCO|nr:hypothetical protein H5410_002910 [Solanum commersonii]
MKLKALVWNVRSIRTQNSFHRIQMLHRYHKFSIIALMEPFQDVRHIHKYKRRLGMQYANYNQNGKIWVFIQEHVHVGVLSDSEQQLSLQLQYQETGQSLVTTFVYAKCDEGISMNLPWLVGGNFNVIINDEEKIGGLPVYPQEYEEFDICVNSCDLVDINFKGSPFTWWNGRADRDCIFKRLDRKPFKFLKFWAEAADFQEVVKAHWLATDCTYLFISLKQKMKNTKTALSNWNRGKYGDLFKQMLIREEIATLKEDLFQENPSVKNRMMEGEEQVATEAVSFFQEQFTEMGGGTEVSLLQHVPNLITDQMNNDINASSSMEEVRKFVFYLNGESASGPDGFTTTSIKVVGA